MSDNHLRLQSADKKLVLVVDDEIINRELLGMALGEEYRVIYAQDGEEALQQITEHRDELSVVLLDLLMPVMSGMVVLRKLKESAELSRIPVIVLTADQDAEVASLELGAIDFIPKPYPQQNIVLARVRRTIELSEDRQIIRSTERDPLTGLYNREFFYSYALNFDQHHKEARMDAIVLDINHFHILNERYGRTYADLVLRTIAERLQNMVQQSGGIVCRREADTFLVYCPHREDYGAILDFISKGLLDEENVAGRIRFRLGVYPEVDKSIEIEQRFDRAKLAADTVRSNYTQNIAVYDTKLHESELFADQLTEDFDQAIRERQFSVYYQPKFDIRPERSILASAEALVRWNHPKLGFISPGVFIPLFEENGMVRRLDRYVWEEAAAQIRRWKERFGVSVPVSVNVSRIDMFAPELLETFRELLEKNSLEPAELLLEITESAYTDDSEFIISRVNALRELGMKVEMDDFGTGYSSLGMISHLPVDALKLDMSFVRNAFKGQGDTRMLELILDIADYLGVPVIAEGVETKEQVTALKTMGCDLVQGYYFSPPVPAAEFDAFVEEKKRALEDAPKTQVHGGDDGLLNISAAMVGNFDSVYYVDMVSGYYMEFGTQNWHDNLHLQKGGEDFFGDMRRDVMRVIHPEDREKMLAVLDREGLQQRLKEKDFSSVSYRLMIDGEPKLYRLRASRSKTAGDSHVMIMVSNVGEELLASIPEEYGGAESLELTDLASLISLGYETIYHVDGLTGAYTSLTNQDMPGDMQAQLKGTDFFGEYRALMRDRVLSADRERVLSQLTREELRRAMETVGEYRLSCRLRAEGTLYAFRMTGLTCGEGQTHFLAGVRCEKAELAFGVEGPRQKELLYAQIAQALSQDYFTIYYINTRTRGYTEYAIEGEGHQLYPVASGENFFADCLSQIPERIVPADRARVSAAFEEESFLNAVADSRTFSMNYQILLGETKMYVNVKAMRLPENPDHVLIGMSNIDAQMAREKAYEDALERSVTFARLAQALAADYFSIYYVDTETDRFSEFTAHDAYEELGVEKDGEDFFNLSRRNILRVMYPEDQKEFLESFTKENLMRELDRSGTFTISYRLVFDGSPTWVSMKATKMMDRNDPHIVIGVNNIDKQMKRQEEYENERKRNLTYSRIARALSSDYYSIYLVNTENDEFVEYSSSAAYQDLKIEQSGGNFFENYRKNVIRLVHPDDLKKALTVWEKSQLLREIENERTFSVTYRLMFDRTPVYINCKVIRMNGPEHEKFIIIGISNVDAQMKREQEYAEDLKRARIAALRDPLTGVKSKRAFSESEQEIDERIARKEQEPFAVVVCDVNGLKTVNDTQGHKAGDAFLKAACSVVCGQFKHSPVYRIGGDEFVAVLRGQDYENRAGLMAQFAENNRLSTENGGIVIACGLSEWDERAGESFSAVFERADRVMYENKKNLKA